MGSRTGRFRRSDRLLDSRDFRRVMRRGLRRAHPDLLVLVQRRSSEPPAAVGSSRARERPRSRLGITASRRVGNAVVRNRFKRRVREWFRQHRSELDPPVDLVVVARRSGARLDFTGLEARLGELLDLGHPGGEGEEGSCPRTAPGRSRARS
jgi:ribonuclease P protein component